MGQDRQSLLQTLVVMLDGRLTERFVAAFFENVRRRLTFTEFFMKGRMRTIKLIGQFSSIPLYGRIYTV